MRAVRVALAVAVTGGCLAVAIPEKGHAACKTMVGSHNGTNMFHETGALGAAINDLLVKVDHLKIKVAPKRVRMGKVRTKCGPWFTKYLLPHQNCKARARVCY